MAGLSPTDSALKRLTEALAVLDEAIDRRTAASRLTLDGQAEIHRIDSDRARLAQALDASEARAARLEAVNREVSRRLVAAMETIRAVLDRHGSGA
jgi:hypothetical protein